MGFMSDFKDFALKGNVVDLAVGVIIGGAFGKIVGSVIDDLVMPIIAKLMGGGVDFSNMYVFLGDAAKVVDGKKYEVGMKLADAKAFGPTLAWGNFITIAINFIILAFIVFLMISAFNKAKKRFEAEKPAPAPAGPTAEQKLLTEIRDLLARR